MANVDNTFTMRRLLKKNNLNRNEYINLQIEFAQWLIELNDLQRQKQILHTMRNDGVMQEKEYDTLLALCMSQKTA